MSSPIWQKTNKITIDQSIMDFMAGEDIILDQQLLKFDIQASKAHVKGLESIRILTADESQLLILTLDKLLNEFENGDFKLTSQFEDCHSAIEYFLVERLGEIGKKVHTGRSRNDQILVATRLFLKNALEQAQGKIKESIRLCLEQADSTKNIPMPGYTHIQRAVPSSCGMWFASFAEAMLDNLETLDSAYRLIDANPLGTAAGYGVNLPLDRELTTKELNFGRIQINPIYTQNSRGKFELAVISAFSQCLLDIRRYSWDISLFSTQEFDFVELPETMVTGSSIMPNKSNPDLIELMRGSYASVQAAMVELQSLLSFPSGYQRDLQLTKGPMLRAVTTSLQLLTLFPSVISGTRFKPKSLKAAIDTPMYATDFAVELSADGIPFRTAYQQVVEKYEALSSRTPEQSLRERVSLGGCANLGLERLQQRLDLLNDKTNSTSTL